MRIVLIRHGQTTGDVEDRYGGDYEDNLTILGRKQALDLKNLLINEGIEYIFCSPRIRAQETAEIIKTFISATIETVDTLCERNHYGILSGMIKADAKLKYPDDCENVKSYLTNATGGESYQNFLSRIAKTIGYIENSNHSCVGVVTHGQYIKAIFRDILKYGEVNIDDCGFAILELKNSVLSIVSLSGITKKE